jgi:hypothetical protein
MVLAGVNGMTWNVVDGLNVTIGLAPVTVATGIIVVTTVVGGVINVAEQTSLIIMAGHGSCRRGPHE